MVIWSNHLQMMMMTSMTSGDDGGENTQMAEPARATSLAKRRTWDAGQAWSRWGRSWDAGQAWSRWWQSWDAGQAWSRWPTVDRQQRAANWWSSNSEVSRDAGQSNAGSGHWLPPPPPFLALPLFILPLPLYSLDLRNRNRRNHNRRL